MMEQSEFLTAVWSTKNPDYRKKIAGSLSDRLFEGDPANQLVAIAAGNPYDRLQKIEAILQNPEIDHGSARHEALEVARDGV